MEASIDITSLTDYLLRIILAIILFGSLISILITIGLNNVVKELKAIQNILEKNK